MPRNYGRGRVCDCGKDLATHQAHYCSVICSNKGKVPHKMKRGEVAQRMPSDDEIWTATMSSASMATRCGVAVSTFGQVLGRRGWRRNPGSKTFTHAPCRECGESFPVLETTTERICLACEAPAVPTRTQTLYDTELARRQPGGDRWELLHLTTRPYTMGTHIYHSFGRHAAAQ